MQHDGVLKISSFYGISQGAQHYYGTLTVDGTEFEIEWAITGFQAKMLNSANDGYTYKAGDMTFRFFTCVQVMAHGIRFARKKLPHVNRVYVMSENARFIVRTDEFEALI